MLAASHASAISRAGISIMLDRAGEFRALLDPASAQYRGCWTDGAAEKISSLCVGGEHRCAPSIWNRILRKRRPVGLLGDLRGRGPKFHFSHCGPNQPWFRRCSGGDDATDVANADTVRRSLRCGSRRHLCSDKGSAGDREAFRARTAAAPEPTRQHGRRRPRLSWTVRQCRFDFSHNCRSVKSPGSGLR